MKLFIRLVFILTGFYGISCSSLMSTEIIRIDGSGLEWDRIPSVILEDASGDTVNEGPDLTKMAVTHDFGSLYLKISYGGSYPTETPDLRIYVDTDDDKNTGFNYLGAGIDLIWNFPSGSGSFSLGENSSPGRGEFMIRSEYDPESGVLEMAFDLGLLENASWEKAIRLLVWDPHSLDHLPDTGEEAFIYTFKSPTQWNLPEKSLERIHKGDLRILSWNVLKDDPALPEYADGFGRVLAAIGADIICFQEFYNTSNAWVREFVSKWQPLPAGQFWWVVKNHDCMTVSRYPIDTLKNTDNNLITEIDTTPIIGRKSWILNAHTPPHAENEAGRLEEADHFMNQLRQRMAESMEGGEEPFAIFLVGDMNTGGPLRSVLSMVEGDFYNEDLYGPGFNPDWDAGGLRDAAPMAIGNRSLTTWRSLNNPDSTTRLDYILYSDSNMFLSKKFVLNTQNVGPSFLAKNGLQSLDTYGSDHLPIVADFRDKRTGTVWDAPLLDGSGWLINTWIGDVYMRHAPILYSPRHGWMYVHELEDSVWIYNYDNGWIWTSGKYYPTIYDSASSTWTQWLSPAM